MLLKSLLDLIIPRPCVMCGNRLAVDEPYICRSCNDQLPRTHYDRKPYDNKMAQLFWGLMPVERAVAWFYYAPNTKTSQTIYDLKYHDQPDIGISMGQLMSREIKESGFFEGIDIIVPVPLAKERQKERGYNQSTMIARGISRETGIPIEPYGQASISCWWTTSPPRVPPSLPVPTHYTPRRTASVSAS